MRAQAALDVEGAESSRYLLVQGQLALTAVDAFDLLLDPRSEHVLLGHASLVVRYAPLPLVLDLAILPLKHAVMLLLHLLDPQQELLPQTFVVLLEYGVLTFQIQYVLLYLQIVFLNFLHRSDSAQQVLDPLLVLLDKLVLRRSLLGITFLIVL